MKLFLTSSGIPTEQKDLFLKSFNKPANEITFYFIPTAADVEPDGQEWVTLSMNQFSSIGINCIWYSLKYKTKEQVESELQDADCIWVNGGNTFYLLDISRKTGFDEVVKKLVREKGVVYGGTSAGTILATKNLDSVNWKKIYYESDANDVGISDFSALSFINAVAVVHYEEEKHLPIVKKHKKEDELVYLIPNGGMIVVDGEEVSLYGGAEKY